MSRIDRIALILSLAAFAAAIFVSANIYEGIPHIEDEITYVWQAKLAASDKLFVETPICPKCFLQPFVIDKEGIRFGKYPPGWPAALSLGIRLGIRNFINPFLSAFFIWLNYLLVKKLTDPMTGLIASVLCVLSPFFLMNSGTLLAHPWSLLLAVIFTHAWLDTLNTTIPVPRWITITVAILSMGLLVLTRPLTAVGICLPFFIYGVIKLINGTPDQKRSILIIGFGVLIIGFVYLIWQRIVTGDFFLNPYILYWPYDKIGFGPGVGLNTDGHQLKYAWVNTKFSTRVGLSDLFGWPYLSWIFLPLGLIAIRKNGRTVMVSSVIVSLMLVYGLYWIGSWVFGPRYYYEALFSLVLLSAAGIRWLAGEFDPQKSRNLFAVVRFVLTYTLFVILVLGNIFYYLPQRLGSMKGLYGIQYSQLHPFLSEDAQKYTPALVIVDPQSYWLEYGVLLDIASPELDSPFVFIYDRGNELNESVIAAFPERNVIYYSPAEPFTFLMESRDR